MNTIPAFELVLKRNWQSLPAVFKKRYSNRSFSHDINTVEGMMEIRFSKGMMIFIPFFRLFHVLVPYQGTHIPVKVDFRSELNSNAVFLDRKFYFPGKKAYEFNSRMLPIKENEVIEYMALGMGWKTHYFFDGKKIVMQHKSYVLKIFKWNIPLPLEWIIGKGHAEEEVIDDNSYRVTMKMSHPLFGVMYSYAGDFTFTRLAA